jgi:protein-disulfide isomerase
MAERVVGAELFDQLTDGSFEGPGEEILAAASSSVDFQFRGFTARSFIATSIGRTRSTMSPIAMTRLASAFVPVFLLSAALVAPAFGQFSNPQSRTTTVHNAAALRPPVGSRVAIVEFEDMECPDCARANPVIKEAIEKYHIPWVRHDFPLPFHTWSFQAAVDARWFDTKSKKLGDDFRDATFAAQATIQSQEQLQTFAQKFAADHRLAFPFVVDPQGKLTELVKADSDLGQSVGIQHTPTIWVVTNRTSGSPFVEVVDRSKLFELIKEAQAPTK